MLQLKNVKKDYVAASNTVHALKGVSLRFRKNEFVSILGASGCGKTTLLNIIGGLDHYTSGDLVICGVSTKDYKDHDWDVYRNHRIGFVFQSYNLIPHQTVLGNVELALTIAGLSKSERRRRAAEALCKVGLQKELHKRPNQLSGGQMQRVAIARALVNNPEILLADEPTGALDTTTSIQIMELIREIAGERLVIMVTHNPEIAEEYSSRIVRLQDGLVISDSNPYYGEEAERGLQKVDRSALPKNAAVETRINRKMKCPYCSEEIQINDGDTINERNFTCPHCGSLFKIAKRVNYYKKPVEKQETQTKKQRRKQQKQRAKTDKKERSSMSFGTSLGLSFRNLMSKKGRTALTSIAGSIGIISVCLVLALSNGFNEYIRKTQEDMLSSAPLEITETTLDVGAIMTGMSSATDLPELDKIGDKVYVNSFLTNIAHGMTVTNDLSKDYIDYIESMDESLYTAIVYGTGMDIGNNLYTQVQVQNESGVTETAVMSLSEIKNYYTLKLTQQEEKYASLAYLVDYLGSVYGKMPGTTDVTDDEFGDYVLSQYDVLGNQGHFPTSAKEAVLVVGGNNDMTDLTLAQLGFISEKDFLELFPQGDENANDVKEMLIDFNSIIGKKFVLNYNDAVYLENDATAQYIYDYKGRRAELGTDETQGVEITISCILRPKEGMNYGCLSNGLYITEQLANEFREVNMNSKIAETLKTQGQKVQEFNALVQLLSAMDKTAPEYMAKVQEFMTFFRTNASYFRRIASTHTDTYISGASMGGEGETGSPNPMAAMFKDCWFIYGDSALRSVGGKDVVNSIQIYTDSFEAKENILDHLDKWNEEHETAKQVKYTDTVGMMMSMVQTMLDAITYVLVAFTAISLVVSSVMIGIITYVSVVERTKEIGVLRSLGARKKDIKNLFNAETFIIGLASGLFGVAVSYTLSFAINAILGALTGLTTLCSLPVLSAFIMVCVSIGLTLISGLIPAGAAAKKDPVIALRTE